MAITARLNDRSAFARALEDAAEGVVEEKLDDLVRIMDETWQRAIDQSGLGTSRPGTAKANVTSVRDAVTARIVSRSFPMEIEYVVAEDAKAKIRALAGNNPPHVIRGHPWLIFPSTETGRKIKVKEVNWRPFAQGKWASFVDPRRSIETAKNAFLQLFR